MFVTMLSFVSKITNTLSSFHLYITFAQIQCSLAHLRKLSEIQYEIYVCSRNMKGHSQWLGPLRSPLGSCPYFSFYALYDAFMTDWFGLVRITFRNVQSSFCVAYSPLSITPFASLVVQVYCDYNQLSHDQKILRFLVQEIAHIGLFFPSEVFVPLKFSMFFVKARAVKSAERT